MLGPAKRLVTKILDWIRLGGGAPGARPTEGGGPLESAATDLSLIRAYRAIGAKLGTAGQPTQEQFRTVREAGFAAVVNLALPTSDNALANEGSVVTGLGMAYVHIPVDFKTPRPQDFRAFCRVMEAFDGRPVFVHCAANMR